MTFNTLLSFCAAFYCGGLNAFLFFQDRRHFVHYTFMIGMFVLAVEAVFNGLSFQASMPAEIIQWQRFRMIAAAFLPGTWLLFSLSFARASYRELLSKWRWMIVGIFSFPLAIMIFFNEFLFSGVPALDASSNWLIPLDWSGYIFYLFFLLSVVFILMNLERTLRASTGSIRYQIKFMILGIGSIFAVRIYTGSQVLLFRSLSTNLEVINVAIILLGNSLIAGSLIRSRLLNVNLYLSESFLYNSIVILFVGIYLLAIGILTKILKYFNIPQAFLVEALIVFLSLAGVTVILLSNRIRQKIKQFTSFHFKRPKYDYRTAWTSFTQRTAALMEIKDVCGAVTKILAETFGVACVTIWLIDETGKKFVLGGSTVFSSGQVGGFMLAGKEVEEIIGEMRNQKMPVDFAGTMNGWVEKFKQSNSEYLLEGRTRYCVALQAAQELLGMITLDERITKETFSIEDSYLLKTIADQAAGNILNIKMAERLREAKEMEAFQTMSSFFVHDLKNLASTLSLTMQNLPIHFDNPEFRNDAVRITQQSLSKINTLCGGLSSLSQKLVMKRTEIDLNELVASTFSSMNGGPRASLIQDLHPLPKLFIDSEQLKKVLTNLILNANEAVGNGGEIRVATEQKDGWVILSVRDNGCGMSNEFVEKSLFRPFKTTKKQGMGIGLFQSKMIVEAHGGRMEVESEEGKGSTFRVMLPVKEK